jgi:ELWxxDGT repeat protein
LSVSLANDVNAVPRVTGNPDWVTAVGGRVVFIDNDGPHGLEVYGSDGTAGGTGLLRDINPATGGGSAPVFLTNVHGTVYFSASATGSTNGQLWKTDGTPAGTVLVSSAPSTPADFMPGPSDTAYFESYGSKTRLFWKTDGTAAGTQQVGSVNETSSSVRATGWCAAGGDLFYFVTNSSSLTTQVWTYDGASPAARLVATIPVWHFGQSVAVDARRVAVRFDENARGFQLWTSDGTAAGTGLIQAFPNTFAFAGSIDGTLYLGENDRPAGQVSTESLYALRPASAPVNLAPANFAGVSIPLGSSLYFAGADNELWATDGTAAGTRVVPGFGADPGDVPLPAATPLAACGPGRFYYAASSQVYVSDGTAAGTSLVHAFPAAPARTPRDFAATASGRLYFVADDGEHGEELWASDGAPDTTRLVADLSAATPTSTPFYLGQLGGRLY